MIVRVDGCLVDGCLAFFLRGVIQICHRSCVSSKLCEFIVLSSYQCVLLLMNEFVPEREMNICRFEQVSTSPRPFERLNPNDLTGMGWGTFAMKGVMSSF